MQYLTDAKRAEICFSLFKPNTGPRHLYKNFSVLLNWPSENFSLSYKGEELRQDDYQVLLHLLSEAQFNNSYTGNSSLAKLKTIIGINTTPVCMNEIKQILTRLNCGYLKIDSAGIGYHLALLPEFVINFQNGEISYCVSVIAYQLLAYIPVHDVSQHVRQ